VAPEEIVISLDDARKLRFGNYHEEKVDEENEDETVMG